MRLLVYNFARGPIGGVESYLRGVTPALIERGHALALLTEQRAEAVPARPDPFAGCRAEWCLAESRPEVILHAVAAWRPDLIWTNSPHQLELERGMQQLAPTILFAHNYNGACVTGTKFHRWPRMRVCERVLGPACWPINFARGCGIRNPAGFGREWRLQRGHRENFAGYRQIWVASRHMENELRRQGVSLERLRRLPYPLFGPGLTIVPPRPRLPTRLLMLARLVRGKGGEVLLRGMARAQTVLGRRLSLDIAGDGPERPRLVALAHSLDVDVRFPGWVDVAERQALLRSADLMAVPSLWPEPFGMVGIEGFAAAVPAVAFAVGGISDWLRPGVNGELADARGLRPEALTEAIVRALRDPEHWQKLRAGALATAAEYALEPHLDRLESMLREAADAQRERTHG